MENLIVSQDYSLYTEEDHKTWSSLCQRQDQLRNDTLSNEYLDGYQQLLIDNQQVIKIGEMSQRLQDISGWSLVPVTGLIPTRDFFYMLIHKKYPINIYIRRPEEIDFSEEPDIFHDVCGHVPLLTNEKFVKFLTAYSIIALKYVNNERAIDLLGRFYWYTYEMGLLADGKEVKPYGAAIITSTEEIAHVRSERSAKHRFDIDHIFRTSYNPYKLQNEYFVINSFDDLFNSVQELEAKLIEQLLLPEQDNTLRNYSLNDKIGRGFNNVIGFLNDVQYRFPKAISFVAGQPDENFFDIEDHLSKFDVYVDYLVQKTGTERRHIINKIGQYGKTKGIVNDVVAQYLRNDENINVSGDDIMITVGAQEAFSIIVSSICNRNQDVILVEDPSYIGVSSFARVFDYGIAGVKTDEEGIDLKELKSKLIEISRQGKRMKLLYVIPDYQNPSGSCMPIGNRLKLLELAQQYNFLIIEDSVYNSFTYQQKRNPTLKSLDRYNRVIYVGSFSKSLFPGLRIGLLVADQKIENEMGQSVALIDEMVKVKAQLTNNTPTINQAILGGVLLEMNCSLSEWSQPKFESYRRKRDLTLASLREHIGAYADGWAKGIRWTEPDGGFFIKMTLPFLVDDEAVFESASRFNVIFCPMRYFYLNGGGEYELRLTFSNLSPEEIAQGIKQLACFLKDACARS
jgi:(S)-3,5-dihydroxyphenylglycine transaminase